MNKEQRTIAAIQKAVPDIVKIQRGCEICVKEKGCNAMNYIIVFLEDETDKQFETRCPVTIGFYKNDDIEGKLYNLEQYFENGCVEIIGRPITLEDVLVASKKPLAVTNYGLLLIKKDISANARYISSGTSWQPNEPFEKQSKEIKELLYNLIVKK